MINAPGLHFSPQSALDMLPVAERCRGVIISSLLASSFLLSEVLELIFMIGFKFFGFNRFWDLMVWI